MGNRAGKTQPSAAVPSWAAKVQLYLDVIAENERKAEAARKELAVAEEWESRCHRKLEKARRKRRCPRIEILVLRLCDAKGARELAAYKCNECIEDAEFTQACYRAKVLAVMQKENPASSAKCDISSTSADSTVGLRCPICSDSFDEIVSSGQRICSTACGHLFCECCLTGVTDAEEPKCPGCHLDLSGNNVSMHPVYFSADPAHEYSCPICLDGLDEIKSSKRAVCSTICGHIFCQPCLADVKDAKEPKCPSCRLDFSGQDEIMHPVYF